jgi:ureidoacrylate peracid hydrolase
VNLLEIDASRTALLMIDLQNDLLHPDGVYARNSVASEQARAVPGRLKPLISALRRKKGCVVASLFTIVIGPQGQPFVGGNMKRLRPFLSGSDFQAGTWGHRLVDEVGKADMEVEKIATSAFYMSRLEWVLWQARVDTLLIAGVATHVSVAATCRDARMRDFKVVVVEDGCAAFEPALHVTGLKDMAADTTMRTVRELVDMIG